MIASEQPDRVAGLYSGAAERSRQRVARAVRLAVRNSTAIVDQRGVVGRSQPARVKTARERAAELLAGFTETLNERRRQEPCSVRD